VQQLKPGVSTPGESSHPSGNPLRVAYCSKDITMSLQYLLLLFVRTTFAYLTHTPMSKVNSLHHIVICTKYRAMTIKAGEDAIPLYKYIWGIINNLHCKLICIGGIENHIHILVDVHQDVALSHLVRDIKRASSLWIHAHASDFQMWEGWAEGYYAFSVSYDIRQNVISYIKTQVVHHKQYGYDAEMGSLLLSHGMNVQADTI
jgi:REP element-mobilizing transposase RayT